MKLQYEREFLATTMPDFRFQVRRISLAHRLRFLAENHELMQKLKFLSAGNGTDLQEREAAAALELELGKRLIEECLCATGDCDSMQPLQPKVVEWLLHHAPTELCIEVLGRISDEISLSEPRRKN